MADYLFVYGTLRRASAHGLAGWLRKQAVFIGQATAQGRLYEIEGYPGMVETKNRHDQVVGDLFRLSSPGRVLKILDDYEECRPLNPKPHEYQRKIIRVCGPKHKNYLAWVYLYRHDMNVLSRIQNGDYLAFLNRACVRFD